jgi:dipeptidyl-peptidase-4
MRRSFNLINTTDSLYSQVVPIQYPKAGEANSAGRIGVIAVDGGETRWFEIAGDSRNHYLARMEWAANSDEVVMQRLNRLQNTNELLLGNAATGQVSTILVDRDSAWVNTVNNDAPHAGGVRRSHGPRCWYGRRMAVLHRVA